MKREWQTSPLGVLLKIQNGYAFDSKNFSTSNGIPLIRIRDLKNGSLTETRYAGDYDSKYIVHSGDLLIGMDGEFRCYEWKGEPGLLNQRVCRLEGFASELLPRFLFYGLNKYLKAIEDVTGYSTVKHLSSRQILDVQFPIPPLPEQKRIVRILDEAFAAIDIAKANTEKNIQNARELFQSYLDLVFSEHGANWTKIQLGELVSLRNGINFTKSSRGDTVKIIGVKDFQNNFSVAVNHLEEVTIDGKLTNTDRVRKDDILFVRSNGNIDLIGRCLLVRSVSDNTTFSGFTIRARLRRQDIMPEFLCHFCKSTDTRREMISSGTGTNIKSLNQTVLSSLMIPVPPKEIQMESINRIETIKAETEQLKSLLQSRISKLDALKLSTLHCAFSGGM